MTDIQSRALALYDKLWDAIAEIRDAYPRRPDDCPTDDLVAVVKEVVAAGNMIGSKKMNTRLLAISIGLIVMAFHSLQLSLVREERNVHH